MSYLTVLPNDMRRSLLIPYIDCMKISLLCNNNGLSLDGLKRICFPISAYSYHMNYGKVGIQLDIYIACTKCRENTLNGFYTSIGSSREYLEFLCPKCSIYFYVCIKCIGIPNLQTCGVPQVLAPLVVRGECIGQLCRLTSISNENYELIYKKSIYYVETITNDDTLFCMWKCDYCSGCIFSINYGYDQS